MPKARKKKAAAQGVGIDFKRVKHKVGRKLPPAQNATKVEFKSKSIVLPAQSVSHDKEGLAVNQRNKSLKELFSQTAHYSERVRKDALMGLKDLFLRHPKELEAHTLATMQKLSMRFSDVDKGVRTTLALVLRTLFPAISKVAMKPLIPFVMAHLGSAMTNLTENVRLSAFTFLELILQYYSELLVPSFTAQIVEYYEQFFNNTGGSRALDSSSMLTVLNGLSRFLTVVGSVASSESSSAPASTHRWSQKESSEELRALHGYQSSISESYHATGSIESEGSWRECLTGVSSLIDALLNCWAQSAPAVCSSPLPDPISLECMVSITRCLCLVFQWLEALSDVNEVRLELRKRYSAPCSSRLLVLFPASAPSIKTVAKVEEFLGALNAGVCESMMHFLVPSLEDDELFRFEGVLEYYEMALAGKLLPSSTFSIQLNTHKAWEPCVKSLMGFLPSVFECVGSEWKSRLLHVLTDVFVHGGSRSSTVLACIPAIQKILLTDNRGASPTVSEEFIKKWLQSFPRLLWELKDNQPSASKMVLETMLCIGKFAIAGSALALEFEMLQPSMIPFLCSVLQTNQGQEKRLFGPFRKLPKDCQELAVSTLYYFRTLKAPFLKALSACCTCPEFDLDVFVRVHDVVQATCVEGHTEVVHFLSFLLTLVVESCSVKGSTSKTRHSLVSGVVCKSLCRLGDGRVLLHLLSKTMTEHMLKESSPALIAGFLRITVSLSQAAGKHDQFDVPESFLRVLSANTASFMIPVFLAKDDLGATILRCTIVILFRNRQFGKLLMEELTAKLRGGNENVYAVGVFTTEICKQEGVEKHLEFTDLKDILLAVKKLLVEQTQLTQLFHLETAIRAAFGSKVVDTV